MVEFEHRTITVDRADQRAVLRGHLAQSRSVFVLLGVVAVLFVVAAGVGNLARPSGWGLAIGGPTGILLVAMLLIWAQAAVTRKQIPIGSEISVAVTETTFDLDGPAGSDRIRWAQLRNLKRAGGGIYFTVAPSNGRVGLPARLLDDREFGWAVERAGRADALDERADAPSVAPEPGVLSSSIVITAMDQRVARAALLRGLWKLFAILGALVLLGVVGLAAQAAGVMHSETVGYVGVLAAIALISMAVLVVSVTRTVARSIAVGTAQTLTIASDALELTGPGGVTRLLWSRLSDLRRTQNVVIVTSMPAKKKLLFLGRLVGDDMYTAIEEGIRASRVEGTPHA